ncbi:P-loop containing nucleoside triphosphate hydrolase protein [Pavlovales sp. CCMP2436]|nr:P-loop containing nucleoside triphosphate hydrolase protein [Pavlovales sp. CCMP2436]
MSRGLSKGGAGLTSGGRVVAELEALMGSGGHARVGTLGHCGAHFIRCVAPSGTGGITARPRAVDKAAVMRQLKADGTLDAVRLMRAGYPVRVPFEQLHSRFLPMLDSVSPEVKGLSAAKFAELLAAVVGVRKEDATIGSTKIFLRGNAAVAFDELGLKPPSQAKMAAWDAQDRAVQRLRPNLLGWTVRFGLLKKRRAAVTVQKRGNARKGP